MSCPGLNNQGSWASPDGLSLVIKDSSLVVRDSSLVVKDSSTTTSVFGSALMDQGLSVEVRSSSAKDLGHRGPTLSLVDSGPGAGDLSRGTEPDLCGPRHQEVVHGYWVLSFRFSECGIVDGEIRQSGTSD